MTCFVLNRRADLSFIVLFHWYNSPLVALPSLIPGQPVIGFTSQYCMSEEEQIPIVLSLLWTEHGPNPRSSTPSITQLFMRRFQSNTHLKRNVNNLLLTEKKFHCYVIERNMKELRCLSVDVLPIAFSITIVLEFCTDWNDYNYQRYQPTNKTVFHSHVAMVIQSTCTGEIQCNSFNHHPGKGGKKEIMQYHSNYLAGNLKC